MRATGLLSVAIFFAGCGTKRPAPTVATSPREERRALTQEERERLEKRAKMHESLVGHRLNMARVAVALENERTARALTPFDVHVAEVNSPEFRLKEEIPASHGLRDDSREERRFYPDSSIQYRLAELQKYQDWRAQAEKEYLREFIANARKGGYNIILDDKQRIIAVEKIVLPQPSQAPSNIGIVRGPSSVVALELLSDTLLYPQDLSAMDFYRFFVCL